jgi:hypothetical protein
VVLDPVSRSQEQRLHVAVEEVAGDVLRHDGLVCFQGIEVGVAKLGRDLEADVEELAKMGVVERVRQIVAERAGELVAGPAVDLLGGGELRVVDVDDGGVGLAEGFLFRKRGGVDLLGEIEGGSTGLGQSDDFESVIDVNKMIRDSLA